MCTVSFIPTSSGFILTSNRDEKSTRAKAIFPSTYASNSGEITFPKDGLAGGTWIALAPNKMICLLNGAFEKHSPNPPYRHSRGKVVLDAFDAPRFSDFIENYNFENIEPHTLVLIEFDKEVSLCVTRWDGNDLHLQKLDEKSPHIWSSSTLYSKETILEREQLFQYWLQNNTQNPENILEFHNTTELEDSKNNLRMKREGNMQTISISQVVCENKKANIQYIDLL